MSQNDIPTFHGIITFRNNYGKAEIIMQSVDGGTRNYTVLLTEAHILMYDNHYEKANMGTDFIMS